MADVNNYKRGETNPVVVKVQTIEAIARGDLVGLSTGWAYPASDEAWVDISTSQAAFAANFCGVSGQRKVSGTAKPGTGGGDDNRMRIATEGVFELDCVVTSALFDVGDLVAPCKASGNALEAQKVEKATIGKAIGRVEETNVASSGKCLVRIFSKVMLGGPQS